MIIIAGLGNPGSQYAGNRHNIGFMAVDEIQRGKSFSPWAKKFKSEISEGEVAGEKVLLMKPLTYMNLSGEAVGEAMRFYKLSPANIICIHDELDLLPGRVRIKVGGGNGGHNGLKSLDAHCGKDYRRLRLGIGHPGDKNLVSNYVLGDFAKTEKVWLDPLIDEIGRNIEMLVKGEDSQLMNRLALATGDKSAAEPKAKPAAEAASISKPTGQSHIRAARNFAQPKKLPESGPMAEMLKKMFGKKDEN
jgi:PTH1 family peptidyl-tRNA hydrolase